MNRATVCRCAFGVIAAISVAGCAGPFFGPGAFTAKYNVVIEPAFTVVPVGQSKQMTAVVHTTSNQSVKWWVSSESVAVLSVSASGEVRCISEGRGKVWATAAADSFSEGNAEVFCGTPADFATPASMSFTHAVGTTACPQSIGTVTIKNAYDVPFTVSVSGPASLTLSSAAPFTVPWRGWRTVVVKFDCSEPSSFVGTLTFTASLSGTSETHTVAVAVTGTITR